MESANEKYLMVKFENIGEGSFFMFLGSPCVKISRAKALMCKPAKSRVKELTMGKDFDADTEFNACDYHFTYIQRAEHDADKATTEDNGSDS